MKENVTQERFYEICDGLGMLQVAFRYYKLSIANANASGNEYEANRLRKRMTQAITALLQEYGFTSFRIKKASEFDGYIIRVDTRDGIPFESAVMV